MQHQELARLNDLAKSLVSGRPIEAAVDYDESTEILSVHLRLMPTDARSWRDCSPGLMDYPDLEEYVRRQVTEFVAQAEA